MCGEGQSCCCNQPQKRRRKPAECTPEQIRECHGEVSEHPCLAPDHPCQAEGGECPQEGQCQR